MARRAISGPPVRLRCRSGSRQRAYGSVTTFWVFHIRRYVSLLFCTFMIRHGRPLTLCSVDEYVTGPEIVGTLRKLSNAAASFAPFVEPPVRFSAAASRSIVAAPSAKLAGVRNLLRREHRLQQLVDRRVRVVAERRRVVVDVVVGHLRVLRVPVRAVAAPRVDDRRLVAGAPDPADELRQLAERGHERDHVGLHRRDLADHVADRLVERTRTPRGRRSSRRAPGTASRTRRRRCGSRRGRCP